MSDEKPKEVKKMTEQEKEDFYKLCDYIKYEILEYDENIKFPRFLALRIKGLKNGQFIANVSAKAHANYLYSDILLTFRINKMLLLAELRNKAKFTDEQHRINYMMKVIECKLNDVVLMRINKDKSNAKAENININLDDTNAKYKKKTKDIKNNILKELW